MNVFFVNCNLILCHSSMQDVLVYGIIERRYYVERIISMYQYYLAYGSNLSVEQMATRCPDAIYVGTAEIKDYRLLFKRGGSGTYLTVEPEEGSTVPVLVCIWNV